MRPAYSGLKKRGQARLKGRTPTIVLGRRFCPDCGRWRHLIDFPHRGDRCYSYCSVCTYRRKVAHLAASPKARALKREAGRFYYERDARSRGIAPRRFRRLRPLPIQHRGDTLPVEPLAKAIRDFEPSRWRDLATLAGVSERQLERYLHGETDRIGLGVADRIAIAMDLPLTMIYPFDGTAVAA